jgi:dienelactone hydrolase
MITKISHHQTAMIILHEIYGANRFIEETCSAYHEQGFDLFCPDMLRGESFAYSEAPEAYRNFMNGVGFDYYKDVERLAARLRRTYPSVFILGFSVGATIAWRCCEDSKCNGIVCCYGSRIRDYLQVRPSCPVLLLFAAHDSFDVDRVILQLQKKSEVETHKMAAGHGFMDPYSPYSDPEQAQLSKSYIADFLQRHA